MEITKEPFGTAFDGTPIDKVQVANTNGITMRCMAYGASLLSLEIPDRNGNYQDVVLGFDRFDEYLKPHPYLGATIGRVAGRIRDGICTVGNRKCTLTKNDGPHHLHGGREGFDQRIWAPEIFGDGEEAGVIFRRTSPDGEEGYPGTLHVEVVYALNERNELAIRYYATTDRPTPVNLTNHIYWNLVGKGSVLNHKLRLNSKSYLPYDENRIPIGTILNTEGTPMDFSHARLIGQDIKLVPGGYEHCYVLPETETRLRPAAILHHSDSGRTVEMYTTKPGLLVYTANKMRDLVGRGGVTYKPHSGVCLQPMFYPDSANQSEFPNTILRPKEKYSHETVVRVSLR